jgi:Helix-turn-helix domain
LVLEEGVIKSKLAEALNVSRQSIDNWCDTYQKAGFEGLVNSYKGRREDSRAENSDKLPRGNKARQLEQERSREREAIQKRQLSISCEEEESGSQTAQADIFYESYDFEENRYAGGFLYWGIFQYLFNFMQLCESFLGTHAVVVYLFAMMLVHGIESVEQLKTVFRREFGKVIGIEQVFSIPTLWKMIHDVCDLKASKALLEGFFRRQAANGLVALYWLYIDGHFIPYYGNERIHKGYYTQRDQMMPGQTEIFVHDCHGQIVYFDIQEGKGNIKEMMIRMSNKWSDYLDNTPPLIIVDRESWGVRLLQIGPQMGLIFGHFRGRVGTYIIEKALAILKPDLFFIQSPAQLYLSCFESWYIKGLQPNLNSFLCTSHPPSTTRNCL